MDRRTFAILCHLLRTVSGLSSTEIFDVEEMVAMFLHVLAHDVKNRVIQREFVRSDETVSRHFNLVLLAVVQLYEELIKRPVLNFLGALDGTYIKVNVPAADRPTFRTHKGEIATKILDVCNTKGDFVYVLTGYYYLCDAGYPNAEGFLGLYRGQRYHLQEWCGAGNAPTNAKEYFNMKRSSTRNVIERAFGVLKGHWAILRGKSEMAYCDNVDDVDEGDSAYATTTATEDIHYIETTNEWSQCTLTSICAPRHVWTKEEEGTLMECLMELVSMGGWKSDNGTFRPGYLFQLSHPAAKGLLNKPFSYYDELTYMLDRSRTTGRFAETFTDVGSNELGGYEGFDMADGNEEFPPVYSQGIDLSQDNVRASRPSRALENRTGSSGSKRKRESQ
ncbi:retrotransposon protein [Cucumis melo var. makuwa]|uniref:Retrotransposon protein n=1 Tax=Cucumis melo var. makuwa TaxID=1194695 RepID=A0A5A7V6F5_CUCMM|nr:retrotransposon protein [Cucumis melo var. makuwa]TYK09858.1 retrotransposon protein [Cucumis melo var. makuwa]